MILSPLSKYKLIENRTNDKANGRLEHHSNDWSS